MFSAIAEIFNHVSMWQTLFSFGFFTIVLLLFLVYTRLHWLLKTIIILFSLSTFFFAFTTFQNSFGWPFRHALPEMWKFSWVEVQEPREKDPGSIRIWLHEFDSTTHKLDLRPRSIEIPYSKEGQKKAAEAQKQLKAGKELYGKRKGKKGEDGDGDGGDFESMGPGGSDGKGGHGHGGKSSDKRKGLWGKLGEFFSHDSGEDSYGGEYEMIDPPKNTLPPKDEEPTQDEAPQQAPRTEGSRT